MTDQEMTFKQKLIRATVVLTIICLASGGVLGTLFALAKDTIEQKQRKVFNDTLKTALGEFDEKEAVGKYPEGASPQDKVWAVHRDSTTLYAGMGEAQGYQSTIQVLVSVEIEGKNQPVGDNPEIMRLAVMPTQETPGLGENIHKVEKDISLWAALTGAQSKAAEKRPSFQAQFAGLKLGDLPKNPGEGLGNIEPVTGATITSTAVVRATRRALERIIEKTQRAHGAGK
mgnify:CR=1 FL=1